MFKIRSLFESETGRKLFSIMLGLALAGLFKMSCDNRSCIIYKAPNFKEESNILKYNDKCYKAEEVMQKCPENEKVIYV